jgi:electron-transferring-flavoprotein dehydrogenase
MKSGMLAAEAAFDAIAAGRAQDELTAYSTGFEKSWLHEELHIARNFKPAMGKGLYLGTLLVGIDQVLFRGKAPWTLHHEHPDHLGLRPAAECQPIAYPSPIMCLPLTAYHPCSSRTPITMSISPRT